jgi:hypothetical protein
MPLVNFRKKVRFFFLRFSPEFRIFAVTEHTRNQTFLDRYPKNFFLQNAHLGLIRWIPNGFSKFRFFIVEIFILIWDFWSIFENLACACWAYAESILPHTEHTRKRFHRTLSMRRTNFRVCSASGKMLTVFTCTSILRIRGNDFIAPWAYEEMILPHPEHARKCLKVEYLSRIEYDFQKDSKIRFLQKILQKISCLCTFN